MHCHPRMLTVCKIYFRKFVHEKVFLRGLNNKSLEIPGKEIKLTVSLGTSH